MELKLLIVAFMAFGFEYMDAAIGMGYGTTLTPVLLLFGFQPLEVVPAVLFSQFVTSFAAGFFHHRFGNVNFNAGSLHLKVALALAFSGLAGAGASVLLAINLSPFILKLYIGVLVSAIGMLILFNLNNHHAFSWRKIAGFGLLAAFNKGMSGGGYGPVVTGGQILSGVEGKNAVGITSLAEGIVCVAAFLVYILTKSVSAWFLVPYVLVGALLSVPFSAATVKRLDTRTLRIAIGVMTIILGSLTLIKTVSA